MVKISELKIGDTGTAAFVVSSAVARKTRRGTDYLLLEFFDGTDKINANYWDWAGKNIPERNSILDVGYQVTEYNGTKQLTVRTLRTNTTLGIEEFMPKSEYNIEEVYKEARDLALCVYDSFLCDLCVYALENYKDLWIKAPGAKTLHHAFVGGTLVHSLSVAKIARAIAKTLPAANLDIVTVGGLLHDIGKLKTYKLNGVLIDMSDNGRLLEHMCLGTSMVEHIAYDSGLLQKFPDDARYGYSDEEFKLQQILHIIASHHGKQEYGAAVPPASVEAHIVHHADAIDANVQMIYENAKKAPSALWTDRIWALSNMPHINPFYLQDVME
jgi:3'-5' exoribonuclease